MKIMYTCDNNYIWFMGISLISLYENNRESEEIKVYLLGKDITTESKDILSDITKKYNRSIEFIDINELPIPKYLENNGRWPVICYARLYACSILKDIDRILYLDCDTIILGDLSPLFTDEYNDHPVYGAKDFIGNNYKRLIGMPVDAVNVNGGVLLFNLQQFRDINSQQMISDFVDKHGKFISYADQDILNGTFWADMGYLDASYDIMSIMKIFSYKEIVQLKHPKACYTEAEVNAAVANPKIIHFTGNYRVSRPWFKNSKHPYRAEFEYYKSMSPWKDKEPQDDKSGGEVAIANKIRNLPSWLSCNVLGFSYCVIRPAMIYIKGLLHG